MFKSGDDAKPHHAKRRHTVHHAKKA